MHNDTNNITKWLTLVLIVITVIVFVLYFYIFNGQLSDKNEVWGAFGDYVGGILNPFIAAFAFFLIAKTYELQKKELEETRKLLQISSEDQRKQIKLAAITSHLNSVLMRIDHLKSERLSLLQGVPIEPKTSNGESALPKDPISSFENPLQKKIEELQKIKEAMNKYLDAGSYYSPPEKGTPEGIRFVEIEREINKLNQKSVELEKQIEDFYKTQ